MENSSNPVTQADLKLLRDDMLSWKQDVLDHMETWKTEIHEEMLAHREETTRHFDVVFENYARDMRGAAKDEFQMLQDRQADHRMRISRLETHMQLAG